MRRHWLQFSIRSVFLLTLCVACFSFGWVACRWQMERELGKAQTEASEAIAEMKKVQAEEQANEAQRLLYRHKIIEAMRRQGGLIESGVGEEAVDDLR